jgi:flavin-dependent dehydrogenase
LSEAGRATLAELELEHVLARAGAVEQGEVVLAAGRHRARLPHAMSVVQRKQFDAELVDEACRAGVRFEPRTRARVRETLAPREREATHLEGVPVSGAVLSQSGRREVELAGPSGRRVVTAVSVVLASGLSVPALSGADASALVARTFHRAPRVGVSALLNGCGPRPRELANGELLMVVGSAGYLGLVELQSGELHAAAALDPEALRKATRPGAVADALLREAGIKPPAGLADARWMGTPNLTVERSPAAHAGVFLVGDTLGYVEPFTGEGITWALAGARSLAPWLLARAAGLAWAESGWDRTQRELFGARRQRCRWLTSALRSRALTRTLVAWLGEHPRLAAPVLRSLSAPFRPSPPPPVFQFGSSRMEIA